MTGLKISGHHHANRVSAPTQGNTHGTRNLTTMLRSVCVYCVEVARPAPSCIAERMGDGDWEMRQLKSWQLGKKPEAWGGSEQFTTRLGVSSAHTPIQSADPPNLPGSAGALLNCF